MRWLLLGVLFVTMLAEAACTSFTALPGQLQIDADDYPLSASDLREIQRITWLAGITKPLGHIHPNSADEVSVICGEVNARDTHLTYSPRGVDMAIGLLTSPPSKQNEEL